MDSNKLEECKNFIFQLIEESSAVMKAKCGRVTTETKASRIDFVTEADRAVEKLLFEKIRQRFPDHRLIGEESFEGKVDFTDDPTWIIDPIDGTTNFVHSFPFTCTSIALTVNKTVVLGVIAAPFLDKVYHAVKGGGSYCNGEKISVRSCDSLEDALVITEMGSNRSEEFLNLYLKNLASILWKCHGHRSLGSAALNCCMLASGHVDCYFEFGLRCWDMAAGALIIQEAGGRVIDPDGDPFNIMRRRILATGNPMLATELSKKLSKMSFPFDD